jgi:hypothetical protein
MTKDEALAMDLALEALEYFSDTSPTMAGKAHAEDAITAIKQARSAPVQEPVAFNAGVPPLYPEMKDGETISVEYTTPPAQPAPVQEPVALPCCGYTDASAIKWNPFNGVVQCHNCGQTYTPPAAQRTWVGLGAEWANEELKEKST